MIRHLNNGRCPKCQEILNEFRIHPLLKNWCENMQISVPEFHFSDAGRGQVEQELYFNRGASNASWTESAHNWGCGVDSFFLIGGKYSLALDLYEKHIVPHIPEWLQWGWLWKTFKERPHFEIRAWRTLADEGLVSLVEDTSDDAA